MKELLPRENHWFDSYHLERIVAARVRSSSTASHNFLNAVTARTTAEAQVYLEKLPAAALAYVNTKPRNQTLLAYKNPRATTDLITIEILNFQTSFILLSYFFQTRFKPKESC